ncbi:MAG: MinD/ParA family ATP-binding protein [Gemmatimonadaceae bacterium]
MSTQMEGLRRFMGAAAPGPWRANEEAVIVVGSGKGGSGASTVAALVGLACAAEGQRTLLVDTDEFVGTLHRLFAIEAPLGLDGIRTGSSTPVACVQDLGDGLSILPGGPGIEASGRRHAHALSPGERRTLFRRVSQLYGDYDVVVVDAGSRLDMVMTAAAAGAQCFVTVADATTVAIAASYALIKAIELQWPGSPVSVVVNRQDDARGRSVFDQIQNASKRFLGRDVDHAGTIPEDHDLQAVIGSGQPLGVLADQLVAGQAVRGLAQRLLLRLAEGTHRSARAERAHRRG